MMKRVSLKPFYGRVFLNNKIFSLENDGNNPFYRMDEKLKKRGIQIFTNDRSPFKGCDLNIYANIPYPWEIINWLKLIFSDRQKNILFCFESPLVNPFNSIKVLHWKFKKIYTWDDTMVDNKRYIKFFIPIQYRDISYKIKKRKKSNNLLVAINTNKSSFGLFRILSPYKTDLYELRLKLFDYLNKNLPKSFSLYGKGWSKFNFINKGPTKSKMDILEDYKFTLAIENTSAPGYITEKIFDPLFAGSVPVYHGAPNIESFIPRNIFIDYRQFSNNPRKLIYYLKNMKQEAYFRYLNNIKIYLQDKKTFLRWSQNSFEKIIVGNLQE